MSSLKLNLLRLRLAGGDSSSSFRLSSPRVPELSLFGARSPRHETYSPDELRSLVRFALSRGVAVSPDLGLAGPVGPGWEFGPSGIATELPKCEGGGGGRGQGQPCRRRIKMVIKMTVMSDL